MRVREKTAMAHPRVQVPTIARKITAPFKIWKRSPFFSIVGSTKEERASNLSCQGNPHFETSQALDHSTVSQQMSLLPSVSINIAYWKRSKA